MKNKTPKEGRIFGELGQNVCRKIENMEKPTIAAINGYALGGGCELAMSCDIRIASEKAKFGQPEVGLGITPGFGGTQRLSRLVGLSKAKELILTTNIIKSQEALNIGLVNKVVPAEDLLKEAIMLAEKIVSKPQSAVRYAKSAINRGYETDIETGMIIEKDVFGLCFATEDQKEGMESFFKKEKTELQLINIKFQGGIKMKVFILGGGTMGAGIVEIFAKAGHEVVLKRFVGKGMDRIVKSLRNKLKKEK